MSGFANRLKMVKNYFQNKPTVGLYPQEIVLELTNHCNLACFMCPHEKWNAKKGMMSIELFKKNHR